MKVLKSSRRHQCAIDEKSNEYNKTIRKRKNMMITVSSNCQSNRKVYQLKSPIQEVFVYVSLSNSTFPEQSLTHN